MKLDRLLKCLYVGLFVLVTAMAGRAWSANEGQKPADTVKKDTAAASKANPQKSTKPTQTAASPQTQTQRADDDVPVMIDVDSPSKKATTIATPIGVLEGSARRNDTYNRISKKAKHDALEVRRDIENAETKQDEAETTTKENESQADQKPPQQ